MQKQVYADNAATTPVCDVALKEMLPFFTECYANPSAIYPPGYEVKSVTEQARKSIAVCLGARSNEIFFTSGGTESDNWVLRFALKRISKDKRHIITTMAEHSAVYKTALELQTQGYEVEFLPVDEHGAPAPEALEKAVRSDTALVSLMAANNEVGTLSDIKRLCEISHAKKAMFHTDAVQAVGHVPINVRELGADYLSLSAHKFGGPKGIGALYIRYGRVLPPMLCGGGQERGGRSGTTNTPGVVGMAAALKNATQNMQEETTRITALRDALIQGVLKISGARLTGHPTQRLPGLASFVFEGFGRPPLVRILGEEGVFASAGSACSAGSGDPSRVLLAMGVPNKLAHSSLRFSLGAQNTLEDVDYILEVLPRALERARKEEDFLKNVF